MKNRSHGTVISLIWYRLNRFAVTANNTTWYRYHESGMSGVDILANPEEDEEEYKSSKEGLPSGSD